MLKKISGFMNFTKIKLLITALVFFSITYTGYVEPAFSYIGPGAGFAFLSSFLILLLTFALAVFYLLSWPLRYLIRGLIRKGPKIKTDIKRVIIIGLDGMDPNLAKEYRVEQV